MVLYNDEVDWSELQPVLRDGVFDCGAFSYQTTDRLVLLERRVGRAPKELSFKAHAVKVGDPFKNFLTLGFCDMRMAAHLIAT